MYRLIIADDEKKICTLIQKLGCWDALGIEIVAVCGDGLEALESILEKDPDIVLTDIRMPGLDGLELVRQAAEKGKHPYFIVLSGYQYFEYAHTAMKYGIADYLLKPVSGEELNQTLKKTCESLAQRRKIRQAEEELEQWRKHQRQDQYEKLFRDLLDPPEAVSDHPGEWKEKYGLDFSYSRSQAFYLGCGAAGDMDRISFGQKILELGEKVLNGERILAFLGICEDGIGGVLNFEPERSDGARNRLDAFFQDVLSLARRQGLRTVTLGVGSVADALSGLPSSMASARERERAKAVLGGNRMIKEEDCCFSRLPLEMILDKKRRKAFEICLESFNPEKAAAWFDSWERLEQGKPRIDPERLFEIREWVLERFRDFCGAVEVIGAGRKVDWIRKQTGQAAGISEFFLLLAEGIVPLLGELRDQKQQEESRPVRMAKAFIEENYRRPLGLAEVAEAVGLCEAYFSSSFKKYTGTSFTEYLNEVRIRAAKTYLRTTAYTNGEIADLVGYADDKYFLKVFKKSTGIRPGEYRKLHYREGGRHGT